MGDSHWYGDYLTGGLFGGSRIRICYLPDRIGDEFRYRAQVKMPAEMNDAAFCRVRDEIGVRGVREIAWFD